MKRTLDVFTSKITPSLTLPPSLIFLIEFLSNLQITHLIFMTMLYFLHDKQFVLFSLSKNLPFLTGAFPINPSSQFHDLVATVFGVFMAYLILHICLIIAAFYQISQSGALNKTLSKIMACLYLLHSRIIFFPCQFFLSSLASYYSNHEYNAFYQSTGWLVIIIIFSVINFALAILKEFLLYQITQTNDIYSIKSNIFHKTAFVYKAVFILVLVHGQNSRVLIQITSIFHFLFCNGLHISIRRKLPFYDFYLLRQISAHTIVNWCFAFLSIIQVFATSAVPKIIGSVDILIFLLPVLILKFGFLRFKNQFEKILQGNFNSPEYAIHYGILLEKLTFQDKKLDLYRLGFLPNRYEIAGALAGKTESKGGIYEHIAEKLEGTLNNYPKSEILLVYLADIYLRKLKNVPRFLQVFRRIQGINCSRFCKKAVEDFYVKLEEIYDEDIEDSLSREDMRKCFIDNELVNSINKEILKEVEYHIKLWKDIENQEVDIKKTVDYALAIEQLHFSITKKFERSSGFQQNLAQILLLIQIVYLNNVRNFVHETRKLIKLFHLKFPQHHSYGYKLEEEAFSTAFIVISLDKKKSGLVLDASGPIDAMFSIKKSALLGQNFGSLFPTTIAKIYQANIQEYAKNPTYKMDHRYKTYGKNFHGEIFELEAHFQLYCYGGKEIAVVVMLKKASEGQMVLIANTEGVIKDCSNCLTKALYSHRGINITNQRMLQDISDELEEVNRAFNIKYRSQEEEENKKELEMIYQSEISTTRAFYKGDSTLLNPRSSYRSQVDGNETNRPLRPSLKSSFVEFSQNLETIQPQPAKDFDEEEHMRAARICEEYVKGKSITLMQQTSRSCLSGKEGARVTVIIAPYVFNGEVYKIVTLSNLKMPGDSSLGSLEKRDTHGVAEKQEEESRSDVTFADEFPVSAEINNLEKKANISQKNEPRQKHESDELSPEEPGVIIQIAENKASSTDQYTSDKENLNKEIRLSRTLYEISTSKNQAPRLRASLILVYLSLLFILTMSILNCVIARKAINEVEIGLDIVYMSTKKVTWSINLWQDALNLYLEARSPGFLAPFVRDFFQGDVTNCAVNLKKSSAALTEALSILHPFKASFAKKNQNFRENDYFFLGRSFGKRKRIFSGFGIGKTCHRERIKVESLAQEIYHKDIRFWSSPFDPNPYYQLNLQLASDILIGKYTVFSSSYDPYELTSRDQIPYTFNNTINDYMQESKNLITRTNNYLQDLIENSESYSKAILAVDLTALIVFCLVISLVGMLGIRAYKILFTVLIRIKNESITSHMSRLQKVRALLYEDIESNQFVENALGLFNEKTSKGKLMKNHTKSISYIKKKSIREANLSTKSMNFQLMKFVLMSIMFMPVLGGLFIMSVSDSIRSFEKFKDLTSQVTVLSEATYFSYLLLNIFNYQTALTGFSGLKVLNGELEVMVPELLKSAKEVNSQLVGLFNGEESDGFIVKIIQDDACGVFNEEYEYGICMNEAEKYGKKGLYALNFKYLEETGGYLERFKQANTFNETLEVLLKYRGVVTDGAIQLQDAFPTLAEYILDNIETKGGKSKGKEFIYLGVIVGFLGVYTGFLYLKALEGLKRLDLARRRVLKCVPWKMVQENKAVGFYVVRTFGKESEMMKNLL